MRANVGTFVILPGGLGAELTPIGHFADFGHCFIRSYFWISLFSTSLSPTVLFHPLDLLVNDFQLPVVALAIMSKSEPKFEFVVTPAPAAPGFATGEECGVRVTTVSFLQRIACPLAAPNLPGCAAWTPAYLGTIC